MNTNDKRLPECRICFQPMDRRKIGFPSLSNNVFIFLPKLLSFKSRAGPDIRFTRYPAFALSRIQNLISCRMPDKYLGKYPARCK